MRKIGISEFQSLSTLILGLHIENVIVCGKRQIRGVDCCGVIIKSYAYDRERERNRVIKASTLSDVAFAKQRV